MNNSREKILQMSIPVEEEALESPLLRPSAVEKPHIDLTKYLPSNFNDKAL
jgi:hypothetical protein